MTRLRLITWNLHGSAKPRIDAVVELLQAHEPDLLALQEVRSGQARRIAGLLRWRRPAWSLKHNAWWPLWWRAEGLAVLSRHKLAVHPTVVLTPGVSKRSYERRILVPAEVVLDDDLRVLLIDAHLSSGGTDEARRSEQAEHLLRLLPENLPSLVAGDLNADPDRAPIRSLVDAGLVDAWAAAGTGPGHTIPANAPPPAHRLRPRRSRRDRGGGRRAGRPRAGDGRALGPPARPRRAGRGVRRPAATVSRARLAFGSWPTRSWTWTC